MFLVINLARRNIFGDMRLWPDIWLHGSLFPLWGLYHLIYPFCLVISPEINVFTSESLTDTWHYAIRVTNWQELKWQTGFHFWNLIWILMLRHVFCYDTYVCCWSFSCYFVYAEMSINIQNPLHGIILRSTVNYSTFLLGWRIIFLTFFIMNTRHIK